MTIPNALDLLIFEITFTVLTTIISDQLTNSMYVASETSDLL